jgi:hypothetical protein
MKTLLRNILGTLVITAVILSCSSEDPNPVTRLTSISVVEGEYEIQYLENGLVESVKYTEGVDLTTYTFDWSNDNYTLTMTLDEGSDDEVFATFEYIDAKVDGEVKKVIHKVIFDDEGDGGKLVQVNYINAPNENIPSIVESFTYNLGMASETGDATWTTTNNQIVLDYSTNDEVVKINFNNSVDAWCTKLPAEVAAVLFENEFYYPYFLSMKEVTSIENIYGGGKVTPDYNDTFEYQYDNDGSILSIENTVQTVVFDWTEK